MNYHSRPIVHQVVPNTLGLIVLTVAQKECENCPPSPSHSSGLLQYYKLRDGLKLRWFPHANTQEQLTEATAGDYHIIETDILRTTSTKYQEENIPSIEDWLTKVRNSGAGVKLNIDADSDPVNVLSVVEQYKISAPVILSVPYPGIRAHPSNLTRFTTAFVNKNWRFPLLASVDLTELCCVDPVGEGLIEFLWEKFRLFNFPLIVEIQARHWRLSWRELEKLLDKSQSISLIVTSDEQPGNEGLYDLLTVRNDIDIERVFYKVNGTTLTSFKDLASTAGSPLLYFDVHPRDAGKIIWSHNTDTWELLDDAVKGPTMMVEADLRLKDNIPIMAHDPGDDNNLTFSQWLDEVIKVDKGMKLDFKELEAIDPVLNIVAKRRLDIKGPVWVNADIVKGPFGKNVSMIPSIFFEKIKAFSPVTLSVGWTTGAKTPGTNLTYTIDMLKEMLEICKRLPQPITFPVRANMLRPSWDVFHWLLQQSRDYTLTVWTSPSDDVTKEDMDFIKRQSEAARIYFDLPEQLRPSFE